MKIFRLEKSIKLPITIEECWEFFSSPKNLKIITPDYMGFSIIDEKNENVFWSDYKVQCDSNFGINMKWVTEISHVKEYKFFVDEQRFGPYKFWHHKHIFEVIDGGVKVIDILDYALPFGFLGLKFHPITIKPTLTEIFNYREKKLIEIFGKL